MEVFLISPKMLFLLSRIFLLFLIQRLKILRENWKWNDYDVMKWLVYTINCNILEKSKKLFELKHQNWPCDRSLMKDKF